MKIKYAEPCEHCCGYGYFIANEVNYHPYGHTYAAEHYMEMIECSVCSGNPLEECQAAWCHLCNQVILRGEEETRVDELGYTVHHDCEDRDPYGAMDAPVADVYPEDYE